MSQLLRLFITPRSAILASLAAAVLLGVVLYYYCSRQRVVAIGQAPGREWHA